MAAFLTLAELLLQLQRARQREGLEGSITQMRIRAVGVSAPKAYLTVVATAQQWVFSFGGTLYQPDDESWMYHPDKNGYLTIDLSAFDPDGKPSFYAYLPQTGTLESVQVEVFAPWELHIVMPAGTMG